MFLHNFGLQYPRMDIFWDGASDGAGGGDGAGDGGDGSGGDGGDGSGGDGADGSGGDGAGDGQDTGGDDKNKPELPTTIEGWQEYHSKITEDHKSAIDKLNDENVKKTAAIDKQGNEIERFRNLQKAMEINPEALFKEVLAQQGKEFTVKDVKSSNTNQTMTDIINNIQKGEGDANDLTNQLIEQINITAQNAAQQNIQPTLSKMVETSMAAKYTDWDKMADNRTDLKNQVKGNVMHSEELVHLAAMAKNMPEVIKSAEQRGYALAEKELTKKFKDSLSKGGGFKAQEKAKKDNKTFLDNAVNGILRNR